MFTCFPLNNSYSEISYNKYIFNNLYTTVSYGLYDTSNNKNYIIRNVSKNYPLTFYNNSNNSDVSNIITLEPLQKNDPILIYVSKGQDYSFNNNDFFRFYDTSYQLLNINHGRRQIYDSSLTDIHSNFYFMNKQKYKFIAITDFCSNQHFTISGTLLTGINTLSSVGASFEITIPSNADNNTNKLYYHDSDNDICGNLFILRDYSYSYYYGDISFSITNYRDFSNIKMSIKSYDFSYGSISNINFNSTYGNVSISNNNLFNYSDSCVYISLGYIEPSNELLNKISAIDLSLSNNNTFKAGFNKNRHVNNSTFKYDVSYSLSIKDYHIIDISKNYPLRLLNNTISNSIYIDETYQRERLGIVTISSENIHLNGAKFYYGSLKIKVVSNFIRVDAQFISISNASVDFSFIQTLIYDDRENTRRHVVYDNSFNSVYNYDFSYTTLRVKNQTEEYYSISGYTLANNIFIINLSTSYSELGYLSNDKLNNNLSQFVSITPSLDDINEQLTNNYIIKDYYIYYNVTDYEDNTIQNIRWLRLNAGAIVEINNTYNTVNNNILNFNTNTYLNSYNFYDDIKVFTYDICKNKIYIPFEITISGYYYTSRQSIVVQPTNNFGLYSGFRNSIRYYPSYIKNFTITEGYENLITIKNIDPSSITIDNSNNVFISNIDNTTYNISDSINYGITYYDTSSLIVGNIFSKINSIKQIQLRTNNAINYNINSTFDPSFIIYTIAPFYTNFINAILKINSSIFILTFTDASSLQSFTISGNFIKPKFFNELTQRDPSLIDLSNIGDYTLTINTKSLNADEYHKKTYINYLFDPSSINISKRYTIRVRDIQPPNLTFYDISGRVSLTLNYLKYYFPISRSFNGFTDITFYKLSTFIPISNNYLDNKPVLLYSENSSYDISVTDVSFLLITNPNITLSNNVITPINTTIDSSCIIVYKVKDLCNNYSVGISLELNFVDIPDVTLIGQTINTLNYINSGLSYTDYGIKFYSSDRTISGDYIPLNSYSKTTTTITSLTEISGSFTFQNKIYTISGSAIDICFTRLGNNYFTYTIKENASLNSRILRLQRLITIVDVQKPWIYFPNLNFTIDGSSGTLPQAYISISNNRNLLRSDVCLNKIDLSFTVNTSVYDLSRVLYNFDLCDNFFNTNDISCTIRVYPNTTPFVLSDISNYYNYNDFNPEKKLNKVTHPYNTKNIYYLPPITFIYSLVDGCNNTFDVSRIVNIVDEVRPSITFSFENIYSANYSANNIANNIDYNLLNYKDYSYVIFDNSFKDFSYVAFNYLLSLSNDPIGFNFAEEIKSIILKFNLSDNFGVVDKFDASNVTITISNSSLSSSQRKTINLRTPTDTSYINKLFSVIDSSFTLIYDISDNQNNSISVTRNVKIIDDPSNNFVFNYKKSNVAINNLTISFGDTSFNIKESVYVNHIRLTSSDISYDISYIIVSDLTNPTNLVTSISGNNNLLYNPSALIYNLGPPNSLAKEYNHNIKYFPIKLLESNAKTLTVTVKNYGPQITFYPYNDISHQSYTPISDASLILNVTSISIYDKFYIYNYQTTISYSGTNFKVILDSSLNINDPSSGTYNIIYLSKDKNNVDVSLTRKLIVFDTQAPIFRNLLGDNVYQLTNNVWSISYDSIYLEYGANVYDSARKKVSYINNITGTSISGSNYRSIDGIKYYISYRNITTSPTTISYNFMYINTSIIDICYEVIYNVKDLCDNEISFNRIIRIFRSKNPILYPYIEIDISSIKSYHFLLQDLSKQTVPLTQINKYIPRFNYNQDTLNITYDLSLQFVNSNNNNIITCEAVKQIIFNKISVANYVRFKVYATSYDSSRVLTNAYVDYSINSLKVFNSSIDYQSITFYAIDNCQNEVLDREKRITLYLKIIDTKPPNITKLTNLNFIDPNKLDYPLLSNSAINILKNNITYFDTYENNYFNYINYYKKVQSVNSDTSNIVLIDPGIAIEDIVGDNVTYINDVIDPSNSSFTLSDINVTYFSGPSFINSIDVSRVLTISGHYMQKYSVKDKQSNSNNNSRTIVVKSFGPIIRLNYQEDSCGNKYTSYLLAKYDKFIEKNGYVRDYKDIDISFDKVNIDYTNLNENSEGSYNIVYDVSNSLNITSTMQRKVEVYTPNVLEQEIKYDFVNLITNSSTFNSNTKFSLANGTYKFDVSSNYAFKLVTRNFDTSTNPYDVSNLISLTSDSSYIVLGEKYYDGSNVTLTIRGNFERCSIKFKTDISINTPFRNNLKNKEFRYFFVYDNANYFINLQNYYNSLKDVSINITKSFAVDVSNINNNNNNNSSGQYFIIDNLIRDLHLPYGVYRFNQNSSNNFYSKIKFSITPDGTHNGGVEYTKTVFSQNLPGISRIQNVNTYTKNSIYTQITINATTPTILYYYSENFRNMGGKIVVKNNIVFLKNTIILNSYVLTNLNDDFFATTTTFLGISKEIMKNRVILNQQFNVTNNPINNPTNNVNTISNINICCVTQQNLQCNVLYDLRQHPNKLIFQAYKEPSNNSVLSNSNASYLLDISSIEGLNFNNSYITYFNTTYESSYSLIKNPSLNIYDKSLKNVFYYNHVTNNANLNNEILNYITFFKKNNIITPNLLIKDFSYNVTEFLYSTPSNILNLDATNIYNSAANFYLLAPRIKITNIIDNYVMFSLEVKYKNLYFQNFDFLVYSSRFTSFTNVTDNNITEKLYFLKGSLVITNNMLYSKDISGFYDSSSVFNKMYESANNSLNTITKNMVFLNINTNTNTTSYSSMSVCGITKQNIYNNMYLDENNKFIFHSYNENSIVNYQVNDNNLTLEKTLKENSNNDYYLLDVCSNIFYNSFNNEGLTTNTLLALNNTNYTIAISYKIYDEISNNVYSNLLRSLYIDPIYINDIPQYRKNYSAANNSYNTLYNYNLGTYLSYNANASISRVSINAINTLYYENYNKTIANSLHTNTYVINLNDYFDINLITNRLRSINSFITNTIDPANIVYTITDISYSNKNFSLFNVESSFNIIFDKVNISLLNTMQIMLFCLYFKLVYLIYILNSVYPPKYIPQNFSYVNSVNLHFVPEYYNNYDYNNAVFTSTLSTSNINNLYYEIVINATNFITIYNEIIDKYSIYIFYVIKIPINPIYNTFNLNITVLNQLNFDINKLVENIDKLCQNEPIKLYSQLGKPPNSNVFHSFADISDIEQTLTTFFDLHNKYQFIYKKTFELGSSTNITMQPFYNQYRSLFHISNLDPVIFLRNFKYNLKLLSESFNSIFVLLPPGFNIQNSLISIANIDNVSNFNQFIIVITSVKNSLTPLINTYAAFETNSIKYISNTFKIVGSQIAINSKVSNYIAITFNVQYKSYFFNYIDLSTVVLDIIIPDLTPPTLLFANNDFSFNQTDLADSSINNLITNLISDISYVDINQTHVLALNNTYYSYYPDKKTELSNNNLSYPLVSIDLTNININTLFSSYNNNSVYIDIIYTIRDNANNVNTIIRKLLLNKSEEVPLFYYKTENNYKKILMQIGSDIPILKLNEKITIETFKSELKSFIYIIDPRLVDENSVLTNPVISNDVFNIIYPNSQLDISKIEIKDLSSVLISSYNITRNIYTDYFNSTSPNGTIFANNNDIQLPTGTYNLKYISKTSIITGLYNEITIKLQILPIIIIEETQNPTHCCYPKVEYKPIQDNYKLGSQNTINMRRAKFIINRNR